MEPSLNDLVGRWVASVGIDPAARADAAELWSAASGQARSVPAGPIPREIDAWERRHGFRLPESAPRLAPALERLLWPTGPLIHPLAAIGPMVPFARVPDLVVQPESWFELGNPNVETICIDLAYRLARAATARSSPRATTSAEPAAGDRHELRDWFLGCSTGGPRVLVRPGFVDLGDPWAAHRRNTPGPAPARPPPSLAAQVSGS